MIHALSAVMTLWGAEPKLPGSVPFARKYAITVNGAPGTPVRMRAGTLPKDWVASFCTPHICAPGQVTIVIPATGHYKTEFQIIPVDESRSLSRRITVSGNSGKARFELVRLSSPSDSGN